MANATVNFATTTSETHRPVCLFDHGDDIRRLVITLLARLQGLDANLGETEIGLGGLVRFWGWVAVSVQMTDDMALIGEYLRDRSEAAFATLVSRHINLVYSVALRQVRVPQIAEDVTQAAFILLSKKASSLGPNTVVSAWLCRAAHYLSADALKSEGRRQKREQEAHMQSSSKETKSDAWMQIASLLDPAMAQLSEKQYSAIVLRFFEGKTCKDIGDVLGTGEDGARMRVNRALEKMRKYFAAHGATLSVAVIEAALAAHSVEAAPVGLAPTVAVAAVKETATSASVLTLIKGAMHIMAWTTAKTVAVAAVAVILAAGATTAIVQGARPGMGHLGSTIDDSYFEANYEKLMAAPDNIVIVRPSHSMNTSGPLSIGGPNGSRLSGRSVATQLLMALAYGMEPNRIVLPTDLVNRRFDFLDTVKGDAQFANQTGDHTHWVWGKLQAEINKQLGVSTRAETREEDGYILRLQTPNAPGLKADTDTSSYTAVNSTKFSTRAAPISALAQFLEDSLNKPVIDQTGLTGHYDFTLDKQLLKSEVGLKQALLDNLGIELSPARVSVQVIVVTKTSP